MASDNLLNAGTEDHSTLLPPSEASISVAPTQGDMPSPTASSADTQPFATSLPTLPISELVLDFDTILQPPPFGTLHESKHNPDFRVRNYGKWLKMATILSDLHARLQAARLAEDQSAFDCVHAQVLKAGEDLDSFTQQQSPMVTPADEDPRFKHEDLGKSVVPGRANERYMVQHDAPEGDAAERDALATKRLLCARKAYEAMLDDVSSGSDSDGDAPISEEQDSEGEDTTLVEDSPDDFEPLHAVSSMTLDGSHAQAAPDSMAVDYPDYYRPEVLQRAADFLDMIQTVNKATMTAYSITLADLDIVEDETSMSEVAEDLPFEPVQPIIDAAETLRRSNEAVMATYGFSVDDLDVEFEASEEIMEE